MRDFSNNWMYCELCKTSTIVCPDCGNPGCNGSYGDDKEGNWYACPTCREVEVVQAQAWKDGTYPSKDKILHIPYDPNWIENALKELKNNEDK